MDHLLKAIDERISRRSYIPEPLKHEDAEALQALITKINSEQDLAMYLIVGNGEAFANVRKTYGFFSGVENYIALTGKKNDDLEEERYGYFGQQLVLEATLRGLGTCWVGGTFDRNAALVMLTEHDSIPCVITVGYVEKELSTKEKTIKKITHRRKSKTIEEMMVSDEAVPDWFISGMEAVQKAPSAINRQPVTFTYKNGTVTATIEDEKAERIWYDLGIAKLHFEIGAGGGSWEFGNGGAFTRAD
ncbi:MAG: nitroreductase [Actinomycetia bacterium]|nr:nitroreductase [Actinomycetes bacterium]